MAVPVITRSWAPISREEIGAVEGLLHIQLPDEYVRFVLSANGGRPQPDGFGLNDSWGGSHLHFFFSIGSGGRTDLATTNGRSARPDGLVLVASDVSGNFVGLAVDKARYGRVYLWLPDDSKVIEIAENFGAFLDSFGERAPAAPPSPLTHDASGLPLLTWDEFAWVAEDRLPSWVGFQSRGGSYGARDRKEPSTGRISVSIATPLDKATPPHPAQLAAYRWLKANEAAVASAILETTFRRYPDLRAEWLRHYPDEKKRLPVLRSPRDLGKVMGLHDVHILAIEKDDFAYVGFEFGCNWEDEHGFGVLTHKDRVVETGEASISFSPSSAVHDDGGRDLDAHSGDKDGP